LSTYVRFFFESAFEFELGPDNTTQMAEGPDDGARVCIQVDLVVRVRQGLQFDLGFFTVRKTTNKMDHQIQSKPTNCS